MSISDVPFRWLLGNNQDVAAVDTSDAGFIGAIDRTIGNTCGGGRDAVAVSVAMVSKRRRGQRRLR